MNREIELTDGSVSLCPYRLSDVGDLYETARESIAELSVWMPWCHADFSIEESRAWIESRSEAWEKEPDYDFIITDAKDGFFLGGYGLNHFDHANRTANISYWVRTSRTKRGVATATAQLLVKFGFGDLELRLWLPLTTRPASVSLRK